ncbi:MAG TPA: ABC transporter substrate-binding protein, partial [Candidatus Limnocylindrales bacterium]
LVVAACGPTASGSPSISPAPPASAPSAEPSTATSAAPLGTVRFALDWTPNTNHTGIYVARANGWYAAAGVDLEILPYGTTTPEALMAAGQAECGISFQDALTFAAAGGAPVVSVMAILQHTAQEIAVLDSSSITRPRELDGKTYAGFGYPNEEPTLKSVIKEDGGSGTFTTVTLDTAAYEALYAKKADFVITFAAWEGLEAEQRGIKLRTFQFDDYGFPDFYQVVLACDSRWLASHADLARAFVAATAHGYEVAADDPDGAAALLVAQNPGVFDGAPELPVASQRFLASGGYLRDASGAVGRQTLAQWQGYSGFLFDEGLLAGPDGKPLAAAPDYETLFTNAYLP